MFREKHGLYGGWKEFRYGKPKKPVTLPTLFSGQKRKHVVQQVMDVLDDFRLTKFENEGICRAGIRSALCLKGHAWNISDFSAADLVAEGLRRIGAVRPSWAEGQLGHTVAEENCNWCGKEIEDTGSRNYHFCSAECARAAIQRRDYENGYRDSRIGNAAYRVIRKTRTTARVCKHCGDGFKPEHETSRQMYCTTVCRDKDQRKLPDRPCHHCSQMFRPREAKNKFCSRACADASGAKTYTKICSWCGCDFKASGPSFRFCSEPCRSMGGKTKPRVKKVPVAPPQPSNVIYLTAEVFDEWFKRAA